MKRNRWCDFLVRRTKKKKNPIWREVLFFFLLLSCSLHCVCVRRFRFVVLLVSHEWNFYYPKWLTAVHSVNSFVFAVVFDRNAQFGGGINHPLKPMQHRFHANIPRRRAIVVSTVIHIDHFHLCFRYPIQVFFF